MKMIATQNIEYDGKRIKSGDRFSICKAHSNLYFILGYAVPDEEVTPPSASVTLEVPIPSRLKTSPKPKRKYKRRDMTAENHRALLAADDNGMPIKETDSE